MPASAQPCVKKEKTVSGHTGTPPRGVFQPGSGIGLRQREVRLLTLGPNDSPKANSLLQSCGPTTRVRKNEVSSLIGMQTKFDLHGLASSGLASPSKIGTARVPTPRFFQSDGLRMVVMPQKYRLRQNAAITDQ